jgi:hypothetical protein
MCDCCDHPLAHAIREILAREAAPIPPAPRGMIITMLQAALEAWEADRLLRSTLEQPTLEPPLYDSPQSRDVALRGQP